MNGNFIFFVFLLFDLNENYMRSKHFKSDNSAKYDQKSNDIFFYDLLKFMVYIN